MGLKILHSADWHMDSPFAGFDQARCRYLKEEQKKIPEKIVRLVRQENCDLVLLSGDIFDNTDSRESVDIVRRALEECAVPVFISPGNHDCLSLGSPWLTEKWPENVHIFGEGLTSVALKNLDCRIYGAGYRSMDCPALLDNFRASGEERYQIAVLHGDPMRLHSPYCPVTSAQVRDSGLHYLALGHIHKSGSFRARESLCGWPGAPMGRGYDETREKGVYIVELGEKTDFRFVSLDTPRFYDLEADSVKTLEEQLPPVESRNFYRVTLTGTGEEPLWELKKRFAYLPNLELIDRREMQTPIWERADEDTLEGTYFRLLQALRQEASPELEEQIRMAAEISARILEGKEVVL